MPNDRPEFRPIEAAPARRVWPFAVLGAIIAGPEPAVSAATIVQQAKAVVAESPNVLGAAVNSATKLAMVARSEMDRELGRTKSAQKQAEAYKKQIAALEKELSETRAQIAAFQKAHAPPPPSDQEQILQMLAPVLRTANDGRP